MEVLTLPIDERNCVAACSRLEEYGESAVLKIEACRYRGNWKEIFNDILQGEGLYALSNFAESLQSFLECVQKYTFVFFTGDIFRTDHIPALSVRPWYL